MIDVTAPQVTQTPAGFARRLAAITYDSLILVSLWFVATIPVVLLGGGNAVPAHHPLFQGYLVALAAVYFTWPWTHGGQTLGMRSWRVRVCTKAGGPVSAAAALSRFFLAAVSWLVLGLGFLAALVDQERRTWHDCWTQTCLITESE